MKGKWKKIAVGGVSVGLAVALLANSLTSHKPVQAVDVFSQTKSLVQPSSLHNFDIVELISERSTFPTVLFEDKDVFAGFSEGQVHIGKEELAYMVGGEEPFAKFWKDLSVSSWMVSDLQQSIQINTFKDSLIAGLENAGLLDINDLTGHPLKIFMGDNFVRPDQLDKILDNAFLEVMAYPNDESNESEIGYFIPMEGDTGCYVWNAEKGKMEYVGARMARAEAAMHVEFQSGWNSNYIGDWESDEDLDDEYEYDEFWDEYENDYDYDYGYEDDYSYDPGYEIYQNENEYSYIENGDVSEERIVEYYYPDEEYTQSSGEVEIPVYQAGLVLGVNLLGEGDGENIDGDVEEPIVGEPGVMYNFYSIEELEGYNLTQYKCIPVYGNAVGDLRVFRYITLTNNEWLKSQVFGIEESAEDNTVKFNDYPIHIFSVTTKDSGEQGDGNSSHNLKATEGDDLSWIIASNNGKEVFADSVKLFYIAQLPGNDIGNNLRNDVLNRVANNTMACMVNDANIRAILGVDDGSDEDVDADVNVNDNYPTLLNLVSYLYQSDLANAWNTATADTTPALEVGDRVNVDGSGVAHFVHKNVYAVDGSFVNPGVSLYDTITRGVDEGFDEVAYRVEQENYQREQDSQIYNIPFDRIDGVTRALAIQFILTYTDSDMIFQKASIRVLELEPCYDFTYAPMEYIHPQVTVKEEVTNADGTKTDVLRGEEARISAFKKDFFGDADAPIDVEIIGMSTTEFCGKIEDLNVEYDMIYWGSNIGTFNKCADPAGNIYTVFNDYSMIGNAYTHVGDVNTHNNGTIDNLLGHTKQKSFTTDTMGWKSNGSRNISNFFRTSGNDILSTQIEKLRSFLDAGYPIVVSDKFFVNNVSLSSAYTLDNISCSDTVLSDSSDDPNVPGGLELLSGYFVRSDSQPYSNRDMIGQKHPERKIYGLLDTSTNIYQLVKQVIAAKETNTNAYPNFMTESFAKSEGDGKKKFNSALNRPKIQINMLSQPVDYAYSTYQVAGMDVIESANYITPDANGTNYLEYEFYISDATGSSSSSRYTAKLYVDANMDGKYVATEEMTLSEVGDLDNGVMISSSDLRVGTHYLVKRELPESYIGAVPWELKIEDSVNPQIRGTKIGLCAVKEEKRDIYICQFLHDKGNQTTFLGDNPTFSGISPRSAQWTALLENVPDFNVHIISVNAKEYFGTNTTTTDEEYRRKYKTIPDGLYDPTKQDYLPTEVFDPTLESYDMLLFGFTELFLAEGAGGGSYSNTKSFGRVMNFIDSGKSVLFTHDTTFVYNGNGYVNAFSYNMRNPGGLDRYGITIGRSTYDGVPQELKDIYPNNLIRNADSSGVQAVSNQELKDKLFHNDVFNQYQNSFQRKFDRDIAYKPGTDQKEMTPETIALTTAGWAHDFSSDFAYATFDYDSLGVYYRSTLTGNGASSGQREYFKVGKVNSGAITEYPYKIDDVLPIARTHAQYYQLDLETDNDGDGDGDTVVWFTLNNSIVDNSNPSTNILDSYNISPYDVRNNYYIYTKDNITYSGAGHSGLNQENEIKLFINTMIASYRVGTKAPIVKTVVNENILNDSTAASIPYDTDVKGVGVTQPIYFQIKDTNLIADTEKFVFYNAYVRVKSPEGAINIGTEKSPIYIKNITTEYNVTPKDYKDYVGARQVVNEQVYRMDVPLTLFEDMDVIEIYIKGESEVHKNNKVENKESNYAKYTISKVHLFDMD